MSFLFIAVMFYSLNGNASEDAFHRRTYQLGATLTECASKPFPDNSKDGTKMFFSSETKFVWGVNSWLPIKEIRDSMHSSWKKNKYEIWVPLKSIKEILPFAFSNEELEGNKIPYIIEYGRIKQVSPKDIKKYEGTLKYQHPPKAVLPQVLNIGSWADVGVIVGDFYTPNIERRTRADHKPNVTYKRTGLWLGDAWSDTTFYFYQPPYEKEPLLFYIVTEGSSKEYDRIKELFKKAYGLPASTNKQSVQNMLGAVFQNEIIEYKKKSSSMLLYKYNEDLSKGKLIHIHWPTYKALQKALKQNDLKTSSRL